MGWRLIRIYTILVYLFMFLPIAVVVLLCPISTPDQFGSLFPMTGDLFDTLVRLNLLEQPDAIHARISAPRSLLRSF